MHTATHTARRRPMSCQTTYLPPFHPFVDSKRYCQKIRLDHLQFAYQHRAELHCHIQPCRYATIAGSAYLTIEIDRDLEQRSPCHICTSGLFRPTNFMNRTTTTGSRDTTRPTSLPACRQSRRRRQPTRMNRTRPESAFVVHHARLANAIAGARSASSGRLLWFNYIKDK